MSALPMGLLPWDVVAFASPHLGKGTDLIVTVHRNKDGKQAQRGRGALVRQEAAGLRPSLRMSAATNLACYLCLVQSVHVLEGAVKGRTQSRRLPGSIEHANMMFLE